MTTRVYTVVTDATEYHWGEVDAVACELQASFRRGDLPWLVFARSDSGEVCRVQLPASIAEQLPRLSSQARMVRLFELASDIEDGLRGGERGVTR